MFGRKKQELPADWKVLDEEGQLESLIQQSYGKPVAIFKHSTSCGISAMAKYGLETRWDFNESELDFYYLDLLRFRSVSNLVAERLKVIHQSPQVILLRNGQVVYAASHHKIEIAGIRRALQES